MTRFLVLFAGFLGLCVFAYIQYGKVPVFSSDFELVAIDTVAACATAKERSLCYEKKIPAFLDEGFTLEQAFEIVALVQKRDPEYRSCHVLAHNISAQETAKDPSKWKDVVARSPYGICGNGASHGAFQERFREEAWPDASVEEILDELAGTCNPRESWRPSMDERANCVHGVGHLAMYITSGNVKKSAAICTAFANDLHPHDFRQTCYEGIFMQVFQPLEAEDRGLVEGITPTYDKRMPFCDTFDGLVRSICIRESWILVPDRIGTPEGFAAHCKPLIESTLEYRYCVEGIGMGVFAVTFEFNVSKMEALCAALDSTLRPLCVAATARRFIQTDWRNINEAIRVCDAAGEDSQGYCYQTLIEYGHNAFTSQPSEARTLCRGLPDRLRSECAGKTGITL